MADPDGRQVVVAVSPKNVGVAIILTILFGPLGMFYSTIPGAIVMIIATGLALLLTFGLGIFITWPVCVIWGAMAASAHNKKLMGATRVPAANA